MKTNTVAISVNVHPHVNDWLVSYATKLGISKAELVRLALHRIIRHLDGGVQVEPTSPLVDLHLAPAPFKEGWVVIDEMNSGMLIILGPNGQTGVEYPDDYPGRNEPNPYVYSGKTREQIDAEVAAWREAQDSTDE